MADLDLSQWKEAELAFLLPAVISQRYTAISVVPAAMGKKVRDVAAKVNTAWRSCMNL